MKFLVKCFKDLHSTYLEVDSRREADAIWDELRLNLGPRDTVTVYQLVKVAQASGDKEGNS